MKAETLRKSILQQAIQGKLVPQIPTEEPASVLLERIKEEKSRLIKEKTIKKEKPLPEITEEEKTYAIPESWEWVRLGDVCVYIQRGKSPKYSDIKKCPVIAQKCNQWSGFSIEKAKFVVPESLEKYAQERFLQNKDLLWNSTGLGTLGRMAMYETALNSYGIAVADSHVTVIRTFTEYILPEYLFSFFSSPEVQLVIEEKSTGTTNQKELNTDTVKNYLVPLPPLAEQKRILEKIQLLKPKLKEYEEKEVVLSKLESEFPEKLKKSLLQYAIQGKLLPQVVSDGSAGALLEQIQAEKEKLIKEKVIKKPKPLPPITEEEKPFAIPESWEWVRLENLCTKIGSGSTPTGGKNVYTETGVKFLREQNVYNYGLKLDKVAYISEEMNEKKKGSIVIPWDLLLNITGGSIGRCALVPHDFDIANINQHILIIRFVDVNLAEYQHTIIQSPYIFNLIMNKQVGAKEGLSAAKTKEFSIPLPPLLEQQRIVARLEELMGLVGRLQQGDTLPYTPKKAQHLTETVPTTPLEAPSHQLDVETLGLVARADGAIMQEDLDSALSEVQAFYDSKKA